MTINETLDQYFTELEEQDKFSGVVLITRGETKIYSGAFGYASRAWKIRNTLDMRFDTASVTKLFTTAAILQLIDKGMITIDTSVVAYLGLEGTKISEDLTDGSDLMQLTDRRFGSLYWTLDGEQIIISGYGEEGIYLMDADGNNKELLVEDGSFVSWIE